MPATHNILGRPRRFASRRLTYLVFCLGLFAFAFLVLSPLEPVLPPDSTDVTPPKHEPKYTVTDISDTISKSRWNPFRESAHAPPRQKQDTYKGTTWWADWKWLSVPFSSSVTLDEQRVLLPPLRERTPIYCYYDSTLKKTREEKDAESDLLRTWRRAWWAQGFRPVILSSLEAIKNPKYNELQRMDVNPDLKTDMMRWFAWESMGAGLLANYTLFPMAASHDSVLTYLRQGVYPNLTRWKDLNNGLLTGQQAEVNKVLRALLDSSSLTSAKSVIEIVGKEAFDIDKAPSSLAHYTPEVIRKSYSELAKTFASSKAKGLASLNTLISAHLHMEWQSRFPEGIEVLQPLPDHTMFMVEPALKLANSLGHCPDNPIPSSCPPNFYRCRYCTAGSTSMTIKTPSQYRNTSRAFSLGTVPHPWTVASLDNLQESIDASWIVSNSTRDPWLEALTQEFLGPRVSGNLRVMRFKQAVAGGFASANALWVTAESELPNDLDWHFGFAIPRPEERKTAEESKDGKFEDAATDAALNSAKRFVLDARDGYKSDRVSEEHAKLGDVAPVPLTPEEIQTKEKSLLKQAKRIVNLAKRTRETKLRTSLEAWNLADTEAWKFTRAYLARRLMERAEWEKEEAKYGGGAGSEKGRSAWNRWRDSIEPSS
ncbi:hypothetical protein B0J13DRAFT_561100 [Dactylonectria estremocensis]|uniref:Uncharacterized protein n=1 Tax=Dactylonectria estremocensis TaxID=1079267 RepID=A0A9P9ECR3_9HYPO|nr:hypothetical protein B0J13DRAFT_561100 [Dactylonectria estremocensis]